MLIRVALRRVALLRVAALIWAQNIRFRPITALRSCGLDLLMLLNWQLPDFVSDPQ